MDIRPALQGAAADDVLIGRLRGDAVEAPIITPAELRVRASAERRSAVTPPATPPSN